MNVYSITTEIRSRIAHYDALLEGCDGDEWIGYNAIIAELGTLLTWILKEPKQ
jgi:hypothetical protein